MHSEKSEFLQVALDFIGSPFRTIKLFIQDLSRIDERLRDDSVVVRLLALATMPFRLIGGFLSLMVQNWPTSRSGIAAILGVPAFFTLIGLLGAWALADKFRSNTVRIGANQGYLEFNLENYATTTNQIRVAAPSKQRDMLQKQAQQYAESAMVYGQKLVEIDPIDVDLKYQLGISQERAGDVLAANDTMKSIAPDNEQGHLKAHLWRARYLADGQSAEEFKASLGLVEKHLEMATAADKENLVGRAQLAKTYMTYANLLEEKSEERLEYLEKADEIFREVITNETGLKVNQYTRLSILRPSVLVRKHLEALAPEKYSVDTEIGRVKNQIASLLKLTARYFPDRLELWALLINSASEIRQFDFAIDIANQGIRVSETIETKRGLQTLKSLTLRKAAFSVNKFDDFEMYQKRLLYLCDAVRTSPGEYQNYILLLQFIGNENEKPTIQIARQLGLAEPGDAVPIKPEWLRRACVNTRYSGFLNILIGIHEFHLGDNDAAIVSWTVAQQFNADTRLLIRSIFRTYLGTKTDKLDNFETMISEFLKTYPEAVPVRAQRGNYYFREKKFQQAIDDYRIALEHAPNELVLHQRIKTCYQYMGQRSAAAAEQNIIETKLKRMPPEQQQNVREILRQQEEKANAGG